MRMLTITLAVALLAGCAAPPAPASDPGAGRQIALPPDEVDAALTAFGAVYDETGDIFAALRQAKRQHFQKYGGNPDLYRRLDELTVVMWGLDGGEMAEAECYIRGFQFGTAQHEQCA